MKDLETVIRKVVDAKAEQDNQIDLNAYENGMRAFAKAINYSQCSTQLKSVDVISFEEWKKVFVVKHNETEFIVRNLILGESDLILAYNKDVELYNSLIV